MPKDIPWGYGHDRVTAMPVDPLRLYVYWEITDASIAAARAGLGPAGERAWLNVRVYDITGRLFDGTNAHSYFDHRVERHERQWFFVIDKPTSTACAEVGLRSEEGYFVKIARSNRVDFPRNEPVGDGGVEWLSVRGATGPVGNRWSGSPAGRGGAQAHGPGPVGGGPGPGGGGAEETPANEWSEWTEHGGFPVPRGQRLFGRTWQRQEGVTHQWSTDWSKTEWVGPVLRTEWESGPFTYPVDVPEGSIEVQDNGEVAVRSEGGRTHVMYGPWQVVIRGIGARAERRVLGTWEYRKQISVEGGVERTTTFGGGYAPGSSEWMMMGASERAWMGASELLYRGASELWLLGASEMMFVGASERAFPGRQRVPLPRRHRTAAGRRDRAAARRRDRADVRGRERTDVRGRERADAGRRQRALRRRERGAGQARRPIHIVHVVDIARSPSPASPGLPTFDPNSPYPIPPRG